MNAAELRGKSEQELRDELLALRREQFNLRMQRVSTRMRFAVIRLPPCAAISRASKL